MARTIAHYFTLHSPWAYLGFAPFTALARRHGLTVEHRPTHFGEVFAETGGLPLARRHPARQRYRLMELQRWREARGVPLVLRPRCFPFDPVLADRTAIALTRAGHDPERFMALAFAAVWQREESLAERPVLARLLGEAGVEPGPILAAAEAPEAARAHEANREAALAAGVFGAPSYVLDGEVFWGQDRLELLDAALTSGRGAYGAEGA